MNIPRHPVMNGVVSVSYFWFERFPKKVAKCVKFNYASLGLKKKSYLCILKYCARALSKPPRDINVLM